MNEASLSNISTDSNSCFLCGREARELSVEHVFPKWLQQRYDIWNKKLELLNGTSIPYRDITIPCCCSCNSGPLAKLEKDIASAVGEGYSAAKDLDSYVWYLWVGKLFFGILRKEVELAHNRSSPQEGTILPPEAIKFFENLHMFLQGIRGHHQFMGKPPYSVLICNLHEFEPDRDWWFADNAHCLTVAIRMGELGVIVALEDAAMNEESLGRYVQEVAGRKLSIVQFAELYAKVVYQTQLMKTDLMYVTSQNPNQTPPMKTDAFWSGELREWDQKEFSYLLRFLVQKWLRPTTDNVSWYVPPDQVPTWMYDSTGEVLVLESSEWQHRKS